jgi:hypothetical protein
MSRAINLFVPVADVISTCAKHDAAITAIEPLVSGGTRVVLMNGDDAARMRQVFTAKIISGAIKRYPLSVVGR